MAGLYFKYGTMSSSKSANLLMIKHNYEEQGFKVGLYKLDYNKETEGVVKSRVGLSSPCMSMDKLLDTYEDYDVIMVDEVQFLSEPQVDILYGISFDKVVLCFGLLIDFQRRMFAGSKRLVELADSLHEIKSVCKCGRRAVVSARYKDDKLVVGGSQVECGKGYHYKALCKQCFREELKSAGRNIGC